MKKRLQIALLGLLTLAIGYQIYEFITPDHPSRPTIPDIPLTLLDQRSTTLSEIGADKHTIVFIMRSNCDFCKKEVTEVRKHLDEFSNTEVIFLSFEETNVIRGFKQTMLPEERAFITFAKVAQKDVVPVLEEDLVFPYMLWYDKNGIQKAQHRGLFPIARILEVIQQLG